MTFQAPSTTFSAISLRKLLENVSDLITVSSPDGVFIYVSPSSKKILGYTPEEMEGRPHTEFVDPSDMENFHKLGMAVIDGSQTAPLVFRGLKKDGSTIWIESTGTVTRNENGEPLEIHGCARDISDRINYEAQLEKKNAELTRITQELQKEQLLKDSIIRFNPTGISTLDRNLTITSWNPALEEIAGVKSEDAVGRNWLDLYPVARDTEAHHNFLRVLEGETIFVPEKKYYKREGYHSTYLTPLRDDSGAITGMLTLVTDISYRKEAELQLADQKNFLKQITDNSPNIIYVYDLVERKELFVNRPLTEMMGYTSDDFNDNVREFVLSKVHEDDRHIIKQRFERFAEAKDNILIEDEYRMMDKAGNWRWMNSRAVVFKRTPEGKVWQVLGSASDITAKKEAEVTRVHLRTTEELLNKKDEFISIASHELKTPLTSVKAYMQLLQASYSELPDENKKLFIDRAATYVEKLNKLVEDLLDISKIQAGRMAYTMNEFNIYDMVRECVDSYQRISPTHQIILSGKAGKKVSGDRQRLEQVIMNLLSNAIKYSPGTDKVQVNVSTTAEGVMVEVRDFGMGIPEEAHNRIFDRFYRVDGAPSYIPGLGIGLYITKEIISRHAGSIGVRSEKGKGSTFFFTLPTIA